MTAEQFTYWLQGFFELSGATTLNEQQVKIVKDHIALVLKKETPVSNTVTYIPNIKLYPTNQPIDKYEITCATNDTLVDAVTNLTC